MAGVWGVNTRWGVSTDDLALPRRVGYNQAMPASENWNMLGHDWAVQLLSEHVSRNQPRHAYLITGPTGVGRRTLALHMAQALNCPQPIAPGQPCLECRTCQAIERMQYPDLAVVEAEQEGGTLKVEQIRELQRSLSLAPYQGRYRIALLLRFEEANQNAANALLKTLEEPPPQVVILLTAQNVESLLPTIVSRCEVLRLRPLSLERTQTGLQEGGRLEPDQALLLAHVTGGRPGAALNLSQQPELMEQRQTALDDHARLLRASRVERFSYAEALAKDRDSIRGILLIWISLWRDVLLQSAGTTTPLANLDRAEEVAFLSQRVGLEAAQAALTALNRTLDLLDKNANTRLALEVLMLDLPKI